MVAGLPTGIGGFRISLFAIFWGTAKKLITGMVSGAAVVVAQSRNKGILMGYELVKAFLVEARTGCTCYNARVRDQIIEPITPMWILRTGFADRGKGRAKTLS